MPPKKKPEPHTSAADTSAAVDQFVRALEHPHKPTVEAIRAAVMGADPKIAEGIKWNAPSYRTTEYFATTNLREKKGVGVILHLGAKVRSLPAGGLVLDDPAKLLKWLAADRATVVFEGLADFERKRAPFVHLVREWVAYV